MELGLQNVQELTGYIEEMFSEYMTFPTVLFIVAIVVALSSIACFILAPFYIKGKARGAKTAAQVISVIDFIMAYYSFWHSLSLHCCLIWRRTVSLIRLTNF